jgi:hypothetical protein
MLKILGCAVKGVADFEIGGDSWSKEILHAAVKF